MTGAGQKKLSKEQRRRQLLSTAHDVVRQDGTDALTLARVAERAGVSKPIAYEHFGTRAGLLMALYKDIDDHHLAVLQAALAEAPRRLEDVAHVAADAYMACYASGPQAHAIAAALRGDGEMDAFHQTLIDGYVLLYRDILAPYSRLPGAALQLYCIGLVGAAEALSRDMLRGRVSQEDATATLAALIVETISRPAG